MELVAQTARLLGYFMHDSHGGDAFYISSPDNTLVRSDTGIKCWFRSAGDTVEKAMGSYIVEYDIQKRYGIEFQIKLD